MRVNVRQIINEIKKQHLRFLRVRICRTLHEKLGFRIGDTLKAAVSELSQCRFRYCAHRWQLPFPQTAF
jgi:hypothetical protein